VAYAKSRPSTFAPVIFRFWHRFSQNLRACITSHGDKRPQCSVCSLIKQDGQEGLQTQHYNPNHKASVQRRSFELRQREFERDHGQCNNHREDLDDWCFDDDCDETCSLWGRLKTSWNTHDSTNKVPEELAVKESPKACPYGIDASRKGHIARIFVPNEISHSFKLGWRYRFSGVTQKERVG